MYGALLAYLPIRYIYKCLLESSCPVSVRGLRVLALSTRARTKASSGAWGPRHRTWYRLSKLCFILKFNWQRLLYSTNSFSKHCATQGGKFRDSLFRMHHAIPMWIHRQGHTERKKQKRNCYYRGDDLPRDPEFGSRKNRRGPASKFI